MSKTKKPKTSKYVYVLRTCGPDLKSKNDFQWPESGPVVAPDWNSTPECGNGLHGMLWGAGDQSLLNWAGDAKWMVVKVEAAKIVDLNGKVKFPAGKVVFCGGRKGATDWIIACGADPSKVIGAFVTAGDSGTATAGYSGTATAGDRGTATAGDSGTIQIKYWDSKSDRYRIVTGYIGENGLKPKTAYRLNGKHEFEEVK